MAVSPLGLLQLPHHFLVLIVKRVDNLIQAVDGDLDRFNSIIDAHSSVDDMIEEWGLADEGCRYQSLDGYSNPYTQAYREERERAEEEVEVLAMFGEEIDVELLIDWDTVEENAYEYAEELAQAWLDGSEWIPEEIMDWAWYDLSKP